MPTITCRHVDTCFSDYLYDRHNRPGEALVGVSIHRNTRCWQVKRDLLWDAYRNDALPFEDDVIRAAVDETLRGLHPLARIFPNADGSRDDDDNLPCAWFLFTYDVEGVE